jgi:hypothetical protein
MVVMGGVLKLNKAKAKADFLLWSLLKAYNGRTAGKCEVCRSVVGTTIAVS